MSKQPREYREKSFVARNNQRQATKSHWRMDDSGGSGNGHLKCTKQRALALHPRDMGWLPAINCADTLVRYPRILH